VVIQNRENKIKLKSVGDYVGRPNSTVLVINSPYTVQIDKACLICTPRCKRRATVRESSFPRVDAVRHYRTITNLNPSVLLHDIRTRPVISTELIIAHAVDLRQLCSTKQTHITHANSFPSSSTRPSSPVGCRR